MQQAFLVREVQVHFHIDGPGKTLVTKQVVNIAKLETLGMNFLAQLTTIDLSDLDLITGSNNHGFIHYNP